MVKHTLFAIVSVLFASGVALADAERDRKARVALALAATPQGPTVAPAPRAVTLPGYTEAYRRAVERGEPLVLYVGCAGRHSVERLPNTVVGAAPELAGYEPGTVVVGYPHAGRLYVHTTLRCEEHATSLDQAVADARKKIAAPPAKSEAAPVPLNWDV